MRSLSCLALFIAALSPLAGCERPAPPAAGTHTDTGRTQTPPRRFATTEVRSTSIDTVHLDPSSRHAFANVSRETRARQRTGMLQTDRVEYRLIARSTTSIRVTLSNTSHGPLYVILCGPEPSFSLERRNGGRWTRAYDPTCILVKNPAIRVGRGEQRTFELIIAHDSAEPGGGGFLVREVTGDYRVALAVVTSAGPDGSGGRTFATPRARFSNVFRIVE